MQSEHLSSEEMDLVLHEQVSPAARAHLAQCNDCAEEVQALRSAFSDLRESATAYAAQPIVMRAEKPASSRWLRWSLPLGVAVMAAAMIPITLSSPHPKPVPVTIATEDTHSVPASQISDDTLLESVQSDLATSVPQSLQPLTGPTATQISKQE